MEVPNNVLPDSEGTASEGVKTQPEVREDLKTQVPEAKTEAVQPKVTPKGDLTPENRNYAALAEERQIRREAEIRVAELEAQLKNLNASPSKVDEENLSDEGITLSRRIQSLEAELFASKEDQVKKELVAANPALKDNLVEFDAFRLDYPGVAMDKVTKLFLAEKGLVGSEPQRKGLERPSGGAKSAPGPGLSEDDVKRLRETQPRKYIQMLRDGKLNPDDIKAS